MRASIACLVYLASAACGRYGFDGSPCDGKVHGTDVGSPVAVTFVQANSGSIGGGGIEVAYSLAQTAGDVDDVVVDADGGVLSLSDVSGNSYAVAVGPTNDGMFSQTFYYARDIVAAAAGKNVVSMNTEAAGALYLEVLE